jgi:CarD family transcriptional regulator
MATRAKAKQTSKTKTQKKAVVKKTVSKKAPVKTAAKKPAPKKVAVKPVAKKVAAKKPAAKLVVKQVAPAKAPVKKAAIAAKPVERKPFDRAQVKAPINTVAKPEAAKAPVAAIAKKGSFAVGEYVVYPTHGVGKILGLESEKIGEYELKVFVIAFEKDKMTLRVPVGRAEAAGLRSISPVDQISKAIVTLKGRAKIARGMWSRRAQEYEAKINSGNLIQIAEVVRDLHKNVDQSERSYSERMIYETAMHRLCGEVAASERVDIKLAQEKLLKVLRKQAA